jgi:hypothetical protein
MLNASATFPDHLILASRPWSVRQGPPMLSVVIPIRSSLKRESAYGPRGSGGFHMPSSGEDEPATKPVKRRIAGRRRMLPADIKRIVEIVRYWPSDRPMTWDLICARVATDVRPVKARREDASGLQPWTRQALSARPEIKKAYQDRQVELEAEKGRVEKRPGRIRDPEVVMLRREKEALEIEIKELKAQISAYEEKFGTMVYNRSLGAMTEEAMNKPLKRKLDRTGRDE